ncbi:hypothetical protein NUK50_01710 [Providencia vermicola]|uniref:hypothetical protein n=1 Tax=Providencia vermicola TaxID=333965 RepID=UPI0021506498|nr:hypothetical protein [Providencia vermicola]MCR4178837.1 hypothetical protein [Providencia vermicola]
MEFNKWFEDNYDRLTRDCNIQEISEEAWDAGQLEERKSNAHLIAAAPDLLEALIEMQRNGRKQGWNDIYESSMEKTRLAIAKALGQQ